MNLSSPRKKRKEGRNSAEANKVCFTMLKYQYISIKRVKKRKKVFNSVSSRDKSKYTVL